MDVKPGKDPSMPFYVNDWLSSPRVRCLSLEMRGAFLELLCYCWSSQDASIPDNDEELAVLSGMNERWNTCSTRVRGLFEQHPTKKGFLTNQKVYQLWSEREEFRKKRAEAGVASGKSRRKSMSHNANQPQRENEQTRTSVEQVLDLCSNKTRTKTNSSSSSSSSSISYINTREAELSALSQEIGDCLTFGVQSDRFKKIFASLPKRMQSGNQKALIAYLEAVQLLVQSREMSREMAEDFLQGRVERFASSPKAANEFLWSAANFFSEGHYDDADEAWGYGAKPPPSRRNNDDPPTVPPLTPRKTASTRA